jgi:transcriptional regulator
MYIPKLYAETDIARLQTFMQENNFAILFSSRDNQPMATHLPFMLDTTRGEYGTLIAHFAKANPHWQQIDSETEVLVVFQGAHSYISPNWYTPPTVVPTWNYATVHAYGKPTLIHDMEQLETMVKDLVQQHDHLPNLDEQFPHNLLQAIVGMEIPIDRLEGKFKFNQNRSIADQQAVVDALSQSDDTMHHAVADIMRKNIEGEKGKTN